jgi:midasin
MASRDFHDPLALNLRRQTQALLSTIPTSSQYAIDIQNASSTTQLLPILSRFLAAPALTLTIALLYRPILYDLCARWLQDQSNTEEQLIALCLLIEIHEELFPYVLFRSVVCLLTMPLESYTVYCKRPLSKRARLVL